MTKDQSLFASFVGKTPRDRHEDEISNDKTGGKVDDEENHEYDAKADYEEVKDSCLSSQYSDSPRIQMNSAARN